MGYPNTKMRIYEAMFLVETAKGRRDEEVTIDELSQMLQKHGAKVINAGKWLDRDLAYPIHKHHQKFTRGVYFLFHISTPPNAVSDIERDVQFSDWIIRALITRDEDGIDNPAAENRKKEQEKKEDQETGDGNSSEENEDAAAPAGSTSQEGDA